MYGQIMVIISKGSLKEWFKVVFAVCAIQEVIGANLKLLGDEWILPIHLRNETNLTSLDIPAGETKIAIQYSQISMLPARAFEHLHSCIKLFLSFNQITYIDVDALIGLHRLEILDLASNHIRHLHPATFRELTELEKLDLSSNKLTLLPNGTFRGLFNLKTLWINNNHIRHLHPATFRELTELEELDLSSNKLTLLPNGTFQGLFNLKTLSIKNNTISLFSSMDDFPENFFNSMLSLGTINMDGSKLYVISSVLFRNLSKMAILSLKSCHLMSIEADAFQDMTEIWYIYLDDNFLLTLPVGLFRNLKWLNLVTLGGNRLKTLPDNLFQNLPNLGAVLLDNNRLSKVQSFINSSVSLFQYVNNDIQTIEQFEIHGTVNVDIDLTGNPLICDMKMCWLLYESLYGSLDVLGNGLCHSPSNLAGQLFHGLSPVDIGCPGQFHVWFNMFKRKVYGMIR